MQKRRTDASPQIAAILSKPIYSSLPIIFILASNARNRAYTPKKAPILIDSSRLWGGRNEIVSPYDSRQIALWSNSWFCYGSRLKLLLSRFERQILRHMIWNPATCRSFLGLCSDVARNWLAMFSIASLLLTGCVTRRLTMRSEPPGARVYVGDEEIGTTPVSHDFTYYGTRKIRMVKDGYETLIVNQPIPAPWYEIPPLDFFSENVVPGEIRDERVVSYQLTPLKLQGRDQLLQKADALRQASLGGPAVGGAVVPAGGAVVGPNGPEVITTPTPVGPGATLPPPANSPQWIYPLPPNNPYQGGAPTTGTLPQPGVIVPAAPPVQPATPGVIMQTPGP
jgi:PEGA domain